MGRSLLSPHFSPRGKGRRLRPEGRALLQRRWGLAWNSLGPSTWTGCTPVPQPLWGSAPPWGLETWLPLSFPPLISWTRMSRALPGCASLIVLLASPAQCLFLPWAFALAVPASWPLPDQEGWGEGALFHTDPADLSVPASSASRAGPGPGMHSGSWLCNVTVVWGSGGGGGR